MEVVKILSGEVTLADMVELNEKKAYEFVIEDGKVVEVIY